MIGDFDPFRFENFFAFPTAHFKPLDGCENGAKLAKQFFDGGGETRFVKSFRDQFVVGRKKSA
jgi:hypothetical protein